MGNPKLFEHGKVYFITFRTEEGLPFVTIPLVNEILWSCVARAQKLYAQQLIGLNFEPNHGHLIIRCEDPEKMPAFIGYVKAESAHAINRLLGIPKHTVWAEGYDSPAILDPFRLIDRLAYTLLNPFKDRLVPSIQDYKGVNSLRLLMNDNSERPVVHFARSSIEALSNPHQAWKESSTALEKLYQRNKDVLVVKFNFYAWKECFPETENLSDQEIRELILSGINKFEDETKAEFSNLPEKTHFPDLSKESMIKLYRPQKFGKKSICLTYDKDREIEYKNRYFEKKRQCKEVFEQWKLGNLSAKFPQGMFAPNLPRVANRIDDRSPVVYYSHNRKQIHFNYQNSS